MSSTQPMSIRFTEEERELLVEMAKDLGITSAEVVRRAIAVLAAEGADQIAREEAEREEGAELLSCVRELGHLSDEFLAEHPDKPVSIEVATTRRVIVKWAGHVFQRIGDRIVVGRRRIDGTTEVAFLDGEEPDDPDVAKFFEQRVLT